MALINDEQLQAAVGVAQLERIADALSKKRALGRWYHEHLEGHPLLQLPLERTEYAENIYWVYGIVLDERVSFNARGARARLKSKASSLATFFAYARATRLAGKRIVYG